MRADGAAPHADLQSDANQVICLDSDDEPGNAPNTSQRAEADASLEACDSSTANHASSGKCDVDAPVGHAVKTEDGCDSNDSSAHSTESGGDNSHASRHDNADESSSDDQASAPNPSSGSKGVAHVHDDKMKPDALFELLLYFISTGDLGGGQSVFQLAGYKGAKRLLVKASVCFGDDGRQNLRSADTHGLSLSLAEDRNNSVRELLSPLGMSQDARLFVVSVPMTVFCQLLCAGRMRVSW
jgi:hypothetical protein